MNPSPDHARVHLVTNSSAERLTQQVADWLDEPLDPRGVGVVLEAEHTCMSLGGVQKPGVRTVTSALHGLIRKDPRTRQEFLDLTTRSA
jgi:GTP cyclohydrolase IA